MLPLQKRKRAEELKDVKGLPKVVKCREGMIQRTKSERKGEPERSGVRVFGRRRTADVANVG